MDAKDHAIQHAEDCGHFESCGVVIDTDRGPEYLPCRNIHDDPKNGFECCPDDLIDAQARGRLLALVHSHPGGPAVLSDVDRQCQQRWGLPFWLVVDGEVRVFPPVAPLLGREFVHGTVDCYTLFRDAYALAGHTLPQFVRADEWWDGEAELYLDNMEKHGFYRVEVPQPGDVILMQIKSDRANHSAIYLGDGLMVHHLYDRLSKRDLYGGYWLRHTHSIWRYTSWQPSDFMGISNDLAARSV